MSLTSVIRGVNNLFVHIIDGEFYFCPETFVPNSDVMSDVRLAHFGQLPVRLRMWGRAIWKFQRSLTHLEIDEQLWVMSCSIRYVGNYVKSLREFGFDCMMKINSLDLSFGSPVTTAVDFKSRLKDACTFLMSSLSKRRPRKILPFKGQARKFIVQLARSKPSIRKISLGQTVLLMKKSMFTVPDEFVAAALVDHRSKTTGPTRKEQSPEFINLVIGEARELIGPSGRYGHGMWQPSHMVADFSLRSTIESNRRRGGSYGEVLRRFGTATNYSGSYRQACEEKGIARVWRTDLLPPRYQRIHHYEWLFKRAAGLAASSTEDAEEYRFSKGTEFLDIMDQIEKIDHLESELDPDRDYQPLIRKIVAITEPLKVRIISTQHYWESPFWADLQKYVRDSLRPDRSNCSGKELPVTYFDHIVRMRQRMQDRTGERWVFVSDDGTAATDSISIELSYGALEHIIPPEYTSLYGECSGLGPTPNQLDYPDLEETVDQRNSQLMGDRRSFAQLTVIHIATKRAWMRGMCDELEKDYATERGEFFTDLFDAFHVNGDDGLIIIPERYLDRYMEFMGRLWELNPIKTQVSTVFFSLNSRMFMDRRGFAFEPPFIRWNIIDRVSRTGSERMVNPKVWNELFNSMHSDCSKELWDFFHVKWKDTLDHLCRFGNNYFLPEMAGGLGMRPPPCIEVKVTPQQNATIIATYKLLGKPSRPPKWMTATVPLYRSPFFKEERTLWRNGEHGLRYRDWWGTRNLINQAFETTGSVKKVTQSTRLVTKRLARDRVYRIRDYESLWFVEHGYLSPYACAIPPDWSPVV